LGGNKTGKIDLSPLSECRDLKILNIDDMKLTDVDLSPLSGCRELEFLKLNDNELNSVDITPLFECDKLNLLEIDRITLTTTLNREIEDWPKGVRKHRKKFRKT
jgi:Leucine-rich repeat (LRR) protein